MQLGQYEFITRESDSTTEAPAYTYGVGAEIGPGFEPMPALQTLEVSEEHTVPASVRMACLAMLG